MIQGTGKLTDAELVAKQKKKKRLPNLFGTGAAATLPKLDALVVKQKAVPEEEGAPAEEDGEEGALDSTSAKVTTKLAFMERSLMVRIARKELNYCAEQEIKAPDEATTFTHVALRVTLPSGER